ncbi:MAG: SDR family NAD(P)-dependent oxidoreductase, partial [Terriglobales bacterium]
STASFQPVPFMTTYAATKAFVLNFSLGLWRENRRYGVHVMALCPGTTATHFFEAAGIRPRRAVMQTAEDVVAAGLRGLRRRRPWVVSGWQNKLMVFMERVMPRTLVINLAARFMETSI